MNMEAFERSINSSKKELFQHPIYEKLITLDHVRIFMKNHVFAVWDFMSLLKTLQRQLTCTTLPWLPPRNCEVARFINEIVLAEESDEIAPGKVYSHFQLYLEAMREVDANREPIDSFVHRVGEIQSIDGAFCDLELAPAIGIFVKATFKICREKPHQVAAAFFYGREDIIPEMFRSILKELHLYEDPKLNLFRLYLERHIQLDGDSHGPLARKMLASLCGDVEMNWQEAAWAAQEAVQARIHLWDGIVRELDI